MIVFDKMFLKLKKKRLTTFDLNRSGISQLEIERMKCNGPVSLATLDKLCEILDCQPADLMEHVNA